jgi:hypothetical protein
MTKLKTEWYPTTSQINLVVAKLLISAKHLIKIKEDKNMLRRHQDSLRNRLEQLSAKGWVWIEAYELKIWHGMDRIGKTVWRDIRDQYEEMTGQETSEILRRENENGFLLIDARQLINIADKLGE